ncbi:hypothetical protein ACLHDF_15050 [Priestia aryabhattai]|uniref:hypothetical protein n=1 Tax=Priestia megaterium TaxID=1404 RepID=UPI0039B987AB
MKKYEKMLLAFNDKELNCYANQGDWLYITTKNDTKKGLFSLANYLHFFVFVNSRNFSNTTFAKSFF